MKSLFSKLKETVFGALRQGWSADAICWSAAWGWTVGVFPIYGVTTVALGALGHLWKLNHSILQAFNYLVSPLKVALILPYVRLGEWMFRTEQPFVLSLSEFTLRFKAAPSATLQEFGMTFVHAICGWVVTVPLWMLVVFWGMRSGLRLREAAAGSLKEVRS
jgi:hypothetical protein